jgi:hypothetical protein
MGLGACFPAEDRMNEHPRLLSCRELPPSALAPNGFVEGTHPSPGPPSERKRHWGVVKSILSSNHPRCSRKPLVAKTCTISWEIQRAQSPVRHPDADLTGGVESYRQLGYQSRRALLNDGARQTSAAAGYPSLVGTVLQDRLRAQRWARTANFRLRTDGWRRAAGYQHGCGTSPCL